MHDRVEYITSWGIDQLREEVNSFLRSAELRGESWQIVGSIFSCEVRDNGTGWVQTLARLEA